MTVAGAALALFLGAALQSATGFGFALVSAPILFALLGPQEAVTAGVLVALVPNTLTLVGERRRPQLLGREMLALLAWSLPGLAVGAVALRELSEQLLSALVAAAVLGGVALRVLSQRSRSRSRSRLGGPPRPWYLPLAGVSSGAMSTATSLNGPPLVFYLLARGAAPMQTRDTLAALFLVHAVLGVPALLLSGAFAMPEAIWALLLSALAGQLFGRRAFGWLSGERYETAVYGVLVATALVAVIAAFA